MTHDTIFNYTPQPVTQQKIFKPSTINAKVVLIGISTGGPSALEQIIPMLPANFPVPVVIAQHMPPMFTASLAQHLAKKSAVKVKEAENQEALQPGTVYIGQGGKHLTFKANAFSPSGAEIEIKDTGTYNQYKPSVNEMFMSAAKTFGSDVISFVGTGLGDDGAAGAKLLVEKGAYSIAQDEKSSAVFGMPRAVILLGAAHDVLPIDQVGKKIISLTKRV